MGEPNIKDILNNIPDLNYPAKKVELTEYDAPAEKARDVDKDAAKAVDSPSHADVVYDRLTELVNKTKNVEARIDDVCKDISYTVSEKDDPIAFKSLSRLFGDDFNGTVTWKMYSQLLDLRFMIANDFAKGALESGA